jgi:hypothetical protein
MLKFFLERLQQGFLSLVVQMLLLAICFLFSFFFSEEGALIYLVRKGVDNLSKAFIFPVISVR